ncbi:MAG: MFS family permease [Candidatus Poriferisodalaceae bacterium]|jgi:MFS family permease|tara:strand:+ start:5047 stop:6351 length:1305 start_codon:yes stop_codon:yes gene_type:complete
MRKLRNPKSLRHLRVVEFFLAPDGKLYEGWKTVLASAAVVFFAVGSVVYGLGVIFEPLRNELGWSTLVVSIGFSLRSEVGGVAAPFVGAALDRYGVLPVVRLGIGTSAIGVLLLSYARSHWVFFTAVTLLALGTTAAGGQVGHFATASWFRARRARAMSLMTLGGALGGIFSFLMALGVEAVGWRNTLRGLALVILLFGFPLSRRIRSRPEGHHQPLDGILVCDTKQKTDKREWNIPYRRAIRSSSFKYLVCWNLFIDFGRLAYLTHLVAFIDRDLGAAPIMAGLSLTISTGSSLIGRLAAGHFADRCAMNVVSAFTTIPFVAGVVILALAVDPWHAYVGAVFGGIGFGASIPVRPAMYVDYFGMQAFGRIMGAGRFVSTTGGFLGATMLGLTVDLNDGSYSMGWWIVAILVVVSIPLILMAKPPVELQKEFEN